MEGLNSDRVEEKRFNVLAVRTVVLAVILFLGKLLSSWCSYRHSEGPKLLLEKHDIMSCIAAKCQDDDPDDDQDYDPDFIELFFSKQYILYAILDRARSL